MQQTARHRGGRGLRLSITAGDPNAEPVPIERTGKEKSFTPPVPGEDKGGGTPVVAPDLDNIACDRTKVVSHSCSDPSAAGQFPGRRCGGFYYEDRRDT
jgi:hypothetical protein